MKSNAKSRSNGSGNGSGNGRVAPHESNKEKAIALAVSTIEKQFGKGAILTMTEDGIDREVRSFSSGAASLDQAIAFDPESVSLMCHLSEVLCRAEKPVQALAAAEDVEKGRGHLNRQSDLDRRGRGGDGNGRNRPGARTRDEDATPGVRTGRKGNQRDDSRDPRKHPLHSWHRSSLFRPGPRIPGRRE